MRRRKESMTPTRRLLSHGVLLGLAVTTASCSSRYSIEPGLWQLRFDDVRKYEANAREAYERLPKTTVHVDVLPKFDGETGLETVELWNVDEFDPELDEETRRNLAPMTGTLENDEHGRLIISITGIDAHPGGWHFRMTGFVKSRTYVAGNLWGRPQLDEGLYANGRWSMKKVSDEEDF